MAAARSHDGGADCGSFATLVYYAPNILSLSTFFYLNFKIRRCIFLLEWYDSKFTHNGATSYLSTS